jgi:hypothetical protein
MSAFYKNSISRIVVVWWATEMPDGENWLKSEKKKKKIDDGERESHAGLRDYWVQPVINQSHHSPPPSAFFFFFFFLLPPFLSLAGRESGRGKLDARFLFLFLFLFLTVIIIATKLLS